MTRSAGGLYAEGAQPRRWATTWLFDGGQVVRPGRDLGSVPVLDSQPVRRFTYLPEPQTRPPATTSGHRVVQPSAMAGDGWRHA